MVGILSYHFFYSAPSIRNYSIYFFFIRFFNIFIDIGHNSLSFWKEYNRNYTFPTFLSVVNVSPSNGAYRIDFIPHENVCRKSRRRNYQSSGNSNIQRRFSYHYPCRQSFGWKSMQRFKVINIISRVGSYPGLPKQYFRNQKVSALFFIFSGRHIIQRH